MTVQLSSDEQLYWPSGPRITAVITSVGINHVPQTTRRERGELGAGEPALPVRAAAGAAAVQLRGQHRADRAALPRQQAGGRSRYCHTVLPASVY